MVIINRMASLLTPLSDYAINFHLELPEKVEGRYSPRRVAENRVLLDHHAVRFEWLKCVYAFITLAVECVVYSVALNYIFYNNIINCYRARLAVR